MSRQTLVAANLLHLTDPDHHSPIVMCKVLIAMLHLLQLHCKNFKKRADQILMNGGEASLLKSLSYLEWSRDHCWSFPL